MNRREAQRHLTALAQAIREGRIPDRHNYPVLDVPTHQGPLLWITVMQHMKEPGWSLDQEAAWLDQEAITQLVLDDEENLGTQERHLGG